MKYTAVIMVPQTIEFEVEGPFENASNHAWAACNSFGSVLLVGKTFDPRLLAVLPEQEEAPKVFDPPPHAA